MRGLAAKFVKGTTMDDDDWRTQSDADALVRAEEIKLDKDRHGRAKAHLQKRHRATKRAAGRPGPDSAESAVAQGYRVLK